MALTIENIFGAETGGIEEAFAISSANVVAETPGLFVPDSSYTSYRYFIPGNSGGAQSIDFSSASASLADGTRHIIGFRWNHTTVPPSTAHNIILQGIRTFATQNFALGLTTGGDVQVINAASSVVSTITAPFSSNKTYYIEIDVVTGSGTSGTMDIWINDALILSLTGQNFFADATTPGVRFQSPATLGQNVRLDDGYWYSGVTSKAERIGSGAFIQGRTSDNGTATPQNGGNNLDAGTWARSLPASDSTTNAYTGTPRTGADRGRWFADMDANALNRYKVFAGKWFYRLKRGSGGGTTHSYIYGNDVDGDTAVVVSLGTSAANFFQVSLDPTKVPGMDGLNQKGRAGYAVSGAQDATSSMEMSMTLNRATSLIWNPHRTIGHQLAGGL